MTVNFIVPATAYSDISIRYETKIRKENRLNKEKSSRASGIYLVGEINDELGELLDIDDVLRVVRVGVDDLCAPGHLQRLLGLQRLLVGGEVPQRWWGETRVGLLDAGELVHALRDIGDVRFDGLQGAGVLPLPVRLEQFDVALVQGLELLLLLFLVALGGGAPHVLPEVVLSHLDGLFRAL